MVAGSCGLGRRGAGQAEDQEPGCEAGKGDPLRAPYLRFTFLLLVFCFNLALAKFNKQTKKKNLNFV